MIVMKFGGTSVGTAERIRQVAEIVRLNLPRKPILVVSAHGGVTDLLIRLARDAVRGTPPLDLLRERHLDIIRDLGLDPRLPEALLSELEVLLKGISMVKELTPRTLDYVMSFGERLSVRTVAAHLATVGLPSVAVDAYDLGLVTDSNFGAALPLPDSDAAIAWNLRRITDLPVVTGFIAKNREGDFTTIGRNGSDYTASILGAAAGAEEIQIWSDVDGVMTADPSIVSSALSIDRMSFDEASELAYYGGRIHPATLVPAVRKRIPIRMLNTFRPASPGTVILQHAARQGTVKSIVHKGDLFLINIVSTRMLQHHGFMGKIFDIFARHQIVIDMVATSEVSVSLTTDSDRNLEGAVKELAQIADVTVEPGKALVCVVGEGIRDTPGVAGDVFMAIKRASVNIEMISYGAARINIAFLVENEDVRTAVRALHEAFFGTGQVSQASADSAGSAS